MVPEVPASAASGSLQTPSTANFGVTVIGDVSSSIQSRTFGRENRIIRTIQDGKEIVCKMSFNMSALRASVGTIPVRQTVRTPQRSSAISMPSFSGLGVSGRLQCGSEGDDCVPSVTLKSVSCQNETLLMRGVEPGPTCSPLWYRLTAVFPTE